MSLDRVPAPPRTHELTVYDASAFRCVAGVNSGEALALDDTLCLGDTYRLTDMAEAIAITLEAPEPGAAPGTGYRLVAPPGLGIDAAVETGPTLTMMSAAGALARMRSLLIGGAHYLLPLGRVDLFAPQTVIAEAPDTSALPLADPTCLAFTRGTRITTQDGRLVPVEALEPGAQLLTRDGRAAVLRAVLSETVPAIGRSTRVVIREGAFANDRELVVAADHRLFVPARRHDLAPGGADRMEPAIRLTNGLTVTADPGGMTEYFHLLTERHEILYAEGIACESFLASPARLIGLSETVAAQLAGLGEIAPQAPHPASLPPEARPRPHPPAEAARAGA